MEAGRHIRLGQLKRKRRVLLAIIEAQEYFNEHNPGGWIPTRAFHRAHHLEDKVSYMQYLKWMATPAKRDLQAVEKEIQELENDINN